MGRTARAGRVERGDRQQCRSVTSAVVGSHCRWTEPHPHISPESGSMLFLERRDAERKLEDNSEITEPREFSNISDVIIGFGDLKFVTAPPPRDDSGSWIGSRGSGADKNLPQAHRGPVLARMESKQPAPRECLKPGSALRRAHRKCSQGLEQTQVFPQENHS